MADNSKIEWTDSTWNPIRARYQGKVGWYCEHVTPGCENCYAERMNQWRGTGLPFKPGHRNDVVIYADDKTLRMPLSWNHRMVFVCSMSDLFGSFVTDSMIDKVFAIMALAQQHTFQVLTKRSQRMRAYMSDDEIPGRVLNAVTREFGYGVVHTKWPLPNVWLGVSAERQEEADERIPHLLNTPAAVRFLSAEPLLGPLNLHEVIPDPLAWNHAHGFDGLDWVIVGGESGPRARPMHPDWARGIRDQCQAAGVAFFMKQWGEWRPPIDGNEPYNTAAIERHARLVSYEDGTVHRFHESAGVNPTVLLRVGKKNAGRLLDGREWNEMPNQRREAP